MPDTDAKLSNLQKANLESHKVVEESLKEALYSLLATKNINRITITELVKKAGVSRAVFYKHYYLVKDVLKKDIEGLSRQVRQSISPSLYENWLRILKLSYEKRDKLLIILKADLGIDILRSFNSVITPNDIKERFLAWNGIVFNEILHWAKRGFDQSPEELARILTTFTQPVFRNRRKLPDPQMFHWAFIGTGSIANSVAEQLYRNNRNRIVSVYNRTQIKADVFAAKYGAIAYETPIDAINDYRVDAVYIATPHNLHYKYIKMCIENHKHVLCEKAFVKNKEQAEEIFALAKKNNVYVSEAMWTWHNKTAYRVKEALKDLGKVQDVECAFSFNGMGIDRIVNRDLYGGAMYDIGIYGIRYSLELFGKPKKIICTGKTLNGVDINDTVIFEYDGFKVIHRFAVDEEFGIYYNIRGENGVIEVPGFHATNTVHIKIGEEITLVDDSDLYDVQFTHVAEDIQKGRLDSEYVTSKNTIICQELMDECFKQLGITYDDYF